MKRHFSSQSEVRRFDLLPELIDGLVWRSRDIVAPGCRVDYYVRHLPLNKDNSFADASFSAIRVRTARSRSEIDIFVSQALA